MAALDLIGLAIVCATTLAGLWMHGTFRDAVSDLEDDKERLAHDLLKERDAREVLEAKVEDLTKTVTTNATTLAAVQRAVTGNAVALMGGKK